MYFFPIGGHLPVGVTSIVVEGIDGDSLRVTCLYDMGVCNVRAGQSRRGGFLVDWNQIYDEKGRRDRSRHHHHWSKNEPRDRAIKIDLEFFIFILFIIRHETRLVFCLFFILFGYLTNLANRCHRLRWKGRERKKERKKN